MDKSSINDIYNELRDEFILIGLTGALASGCTQSAKILNKIDESQVKETLIKINDEIVNQSSNQNNSEIHRISCHFDSLEPYRLRRINNFIQEKNWKPFYHLKVSNLLFCLLFTEKHIDNPHLHIKKWLNTKNITIDEIHRLCSRISSLILGQYTSEYVDKEEIAKNKKLSNYLNELDKIINKTADKTSSYYTTDFQYIGNSLRKDGLKDFVENSSAYKHILTNSVFTISDFINKCIKRLRVEGHHFFVLDALRNLHEINFFKTRYANFYLFSINAEEEIRKYRMLSDFGYNEPEYQCIIQREKEKNNLHSQNINECLSNGDVFISNNGHIEELQYQLIKAVTLIRHPGLFTPTKDERYMQIALTARYNSGCISRQVGACVIGKDGYILGIGWNDVPESSIPCLYRSSRSLLIENNRSPEFSEYELNSDFKDYISETLGTNNYPFCFKDIENKRSAHEALTKICNNYPSLDLDEQCKKVLIKEFKNPTRERALHAEENAFLQSSKVGGGSIKNGTLYTTASPCQLCAKKAMQLGIIRIVYIDAYPDISNTQTLRSGDKNKYPKLDSFFGVAESAFMKLYKPLFNIKDEVNAILED